MMDSFHFTSVNPQSSIGPTRSQRSNKTSRRQVSELCQALSLLALTPFFALPAPQNTACDQCKRKRIKCVRVEVLDAQGRAMSDGPCRSCLKTGVDCTYVSQTSVSRANSLLTPLSLLRPLQVQCSRSTSDGNAMLQARPRRWLQLQRPLRRGYCQQQARKLASKKRVGRVDELFDLFAVQAAKPRVQPSFAHGRGAYIRAHRAPALKAAGSPYDRHDVIPISLLRAFYVFGVMDQPASARSGLASILGLA